MTSSISGQLGDKNDPLDDFAFRIRMDVLEEVRDMFEKARSEFSCGCPESRLCNHESELDGYDTAESMVHDLMENYKRKFK